jgi:hypothetical protein
MVSRFRELCDELNNTLMGTSLGRLHRSKRGVLASSCQVRVQTRRPIWQRDDRNPEIEAWWREQRSTKYMVSNTVRYPGRHLRDP